MEVALNCCTKNLTVFAGFVSCHIYNSVMEVQNPFMTKLWHIVLFVFYVVSAFILFSWGYDIVHYFPILSSLCPQETCNVILVYRLSLAYFIFHIVLAVLLYGLSSAEGDRAKLQNASWQIKLPGLLLLLVACAFVPESVLIVFGWVALFGALVFILIQLVLVIDLAYGVVELSLHIDIADQAATSGQAAQGRTSNPWRGFFIIMSVLMIITSFILLIYGWMLLGELPDCHVNILILVIYLILMIVIVVFSLHPRVQEKIPSAGLLQVAIVGLYATYLLWNAIIVDDPGQCTAPFIVGSTVYWVTLFIGAAYAIGLVFYCTIPKPGEESGCYNYSKVNLFYAFTALYLAMISTNWSVIRRYGDDAHEVEISLGWLPVIFDVLSMLVLVVMFLATLVGPFCCPHRFTKAEGDLPPVPEGKRRSSRVRELPIDDDEV